MPRWVRWLQPLLSGVFTVDNLDYVRRDACMTGVAVDIDVERLRRYAFIGERGLTLYEPGLAALELFLTSRLFLYQQVYFHRTVRAIDLDLAEVFGPSIRAIFGDASPADALAAYADLDEYALAPPGGALGARRVRGGRTRAGRRPGDAGGRRRLAGDPPAPAALAGRGRDPRRVRGRADARRRDRRARRGRARAGSRSTWRSSTPGRPMRRRRTRCSRSRAATDRRCRSPASLGRLPAYALIARRYRRAGLTGRARAARTPAP